MLPNLSLFFFLLTCLSYSLTAQQFGVHVTSDHVVLFGDSLTGSGNKLIWYPDIGAFRSGGVDISDVTYWDIDSIGLYSAGFGYQTKSKGTNSMSWGTDGQALGERSTTWGSSNLVEGFNSTSWGEANLVSDDLSTAWGGYNSVKGDDNTVWGRENQIDGAGLTAWGESNEVEGESTTVWGILNRVDGRLSTTWGSQNTTSMGSHNTAWGELNTSSGQNGTVWGRSNVSSGQMTTSWGFLNTCSGPQATTWGVSNAASGNYTTAFGQGNIAQSSSETVMGYWADTIVGASPVFQNGRDQLLAVGNGLGPTERNNAFTILKNGQIGMGTNDFGIDDAVLHSNGAKLTSSGVWMDASDINKKQNIKELSYGLSTILKLHPVSYDYKIDNTPSIGFIAQEVEGLIPQIVSGADGSKAMSYGQLTAVLTKAIQEQQALISDQSKLIRQLEIRIEHLENN